MSQFKNYYRILNVGRYAARSDIRRSFRRLAKKYHPDTTHLEPGLAEAHMRILLEAYRILMDEEKRAAYDLRFRVSLSRGGNSYVDRLRARKDDPYSRALLVLYRLLEGKRDEALRLYAHLEPLLEGGRAGLRQLLGFGDYLDFVFLLAEAHEGRGDFSRAAELYEEAYREDLKWNYFRRFRAELKHRIRTVYCRHLARQAEPARALFLYRHLLDNYSFPRQEQAYFLKKIAECHYELGDLSSARSSLLSADKLKPSLAGTKKLREKLRETPVSSA